MALLTLAQLTSAVRDEIPSKEQALIVRAANKVIRRIQTDFIQPKRSTFTTKVATTSGTVSVTQDSTTATFSGSVLSTSDPLRLCRIEGDSTWFEMARVSGTGGTLSSAWAQATNATATYTMIYPVISFPTTIGEILAVWIGNEKPLGFAATEADSAWSTTTGTPLLWSPYSHDDAAADPNNDLLRIRLHPAPLVRTVLSFLHKPRTAYLDPAGATTQTIPLPNIWDEAIVQGTLFHLWKQESMKDQALLQSAIYELALSRARGAAYPSGVISPRSYSRGVWVEENRPIG